MEECDSSSEESKSPTFNMEELKESIDFFDCLSLDDVKVEENMEKEAETGPIDLITFVEENYGATIGILNKENYKDLQRPLIVAFHSFKKYTLILRKWMDLIAKYALKFDKIKFFIADVEDCRLFHCNIGYMEDRRSLNLPPRIYAVDTKERQFYLTGNISERSKKASKPIEMLQDFCKDLLEDKLLLSQPIPKEAISSTTAVKIAVGSTFQALVEEVQKDVLLTVYADWCCFSKELLPVLDKLSLLLQDDAESLSIIKIVHEGNYIPLKYNVHSYPYVVYLRRDDKENPVQYRNGPRTIENLLKFVTNNATFELKNFDREGNCRKNEEY